MVLGLTNVTKKCNVWGGSLNFCIIFSLGVIDIAKNLKQLRHLTLDHTKTTDKGFVSVAKELPRLLSIGLEGCKISDTGLTTASQYLGNLEEFNFGSQLITDDGVVFALRHCKALTDLTLTFCPKISIVSVEHAVQNLPCLTHLGIEQCSQVSLNGIDAIRQHSNVTISSF